MKIDLVHPWGVFWHMGGGWVRALRKLGVLGRTFPLREESVSDFLGQRPGAGADLVIFLCADQHMPFLHDDPEVIAALRAIECPTLCYANESILDTIWSPRSIPNAERARAVYDYYLVADETDVAFDFGEEVVVAWCPQFADGDAFKPTLPLHQRDQRAFFFGQVSTFDFDEAIYADRRAIIRAVKDLPEFHIVEQYIETHKTPRKLARLFNQHAQSLCLPTNVGTYTNRVYESAACENLILHYHMKNRPEHAALFTDGVDYVRFDKDDTDQLIDKVRHYRSHREEAALIAASGHEKFLRYHSIEQRVRQIARFVTEDRDPRVHEFELAVPDDFLPPTPRWKHWLRFAS